MINALHFFSTKIGCVRKAYLERDLPGGAMMNLDSQATELLTGLLKGIDGAHQVQRDVLFEALVVVVDLTALQPTKKVMYCSACKLTT